MRDRLIWSLPQYGTNTIWGHLFPAMYKLWVRCKASLFLHRQRHVSPTMVAKTGEEMHMYTAPLVGTRARWRESLGFQSVQTLLPDFWVHVL